mgnify:FL=1
MTDRGPETEILWPTRLPYEALAGVRTRRTVALLFDLLLISMIFWGFFVVFAILGIVTFGLSWLLIPALYPAIAILYNGFSISGPRLATPGMGLMDLEMRSQDGRPATFLQAAAHVILFYLSWGITLLAPINLLTSILNNDKRCLHDIVSGVVVTRRA